MLLVLVLLYDKLGGTERGGTHSFKERAGVKGDVRGGFPEEEGLERGIEV